MKRNSEPFMHIPSGSIRVDDYLLVEVTRSGLVSIMTMSEEKAADLDDLSSDIHVFIVKISTDIDS